MFRFSLFAFSLFLLPFSSAWAAESGVKIGIFDARKIIEELNAEMPVKKGGTTKVPSAKP